MIMQIARPSPRSRQLLERKPAAMRKLLLCLTLVAFCTAPLAQGAVVELPLGETPLGDIGLFDVAYQSYGGEVVKMPRSWTGHFHPVSGIAYIPHERMLDREAILLHSPWRVPPGKVWVDYQLRLPEISPITFSIGTVSYTHLTLPTKRIV